MRSTPCLGWRVSRQAICTAHVSRLPESLQNVAKPKPILCQGRRRKLKPGSVSASVHDSSASLAYFRAAKLAPHNVSYTLTTHTKISPRKLNQRRDSSTTCLKRCCRANIIHHLVACVAYDRLPSRPMSPPQCSSAGTQANASPCDLCLAFSAHHHHRSCQIAALICFRQVHPTCPPCSPKLPPRWCMSSKQR